MKLNLLLAENILNSLSTMSSRSKGIVGYAIARNMRLLSQELTEYHKIKQELFLKYGEQKDGQLYIDKDNENFDKFVSELSKYDVLEIDVDFMQVEEKDLIESGLNGDEMFFLMQYMLKESKDDNTNLQS